MNIQLFRKRVHKIAVTLLHPNCWQALRYGVFATTDNLMVLQKLSVDGIIDVGANRGQFSLACRMALPRIPIVAFEPIPSEAATFLKVHRKFSNVTLIEAALGPKTGSSILHLSKSADSSSLLPIGRRQTELHQNTDEVGTIEVLVHRLDEFHLHWFQSKRLLLKLDVQGYELCVLQGAQEALKHCAYVYAECSEVPLYDGQALRAQVESFLNEHNFTLKSRHNEEWDQGMLIQADYLFVKNK